MTASGEFFLILRRVRRLVPTFIFLSVVGSLVAKFVLKVPSDVLAVTVAIPAIGLFAISRLLILLMPRKAPQINLSDVPAPILGLTVVIAVAAIGSLDFLISGAVLYQIGLPGVAVGALKLTVASSIALMIAAFLLVVTLVVKHALGVINAFGEYTSGVLYHIIWRFMLLPRNFTDGIERVNRSAKAEIPLPPRI